jgi:succinate-semialdehyde dehydrogenase/glutarate-semialdehyde dehydrogenase
VTTLSSSYPPLALYIDGHFIGAGEREGEDVINPANLRVLGRLPHATAEDVDKAIQAAARAFESWRWRSPLERGSILRRVADLIRQKADDIARDLTLDQGKPLAEARAEVFNAAEHAEWHAEECRRIYGRVIPPRNPDVRQTVIRQPVGVCAAFTPWNFPFNQALRKISAALGAGCTLVIKGSEDAPSAVVALIRLFDEAGLPPGCLNLVWGNPAAISDRLIRSPLVRKISFTGSVGVGKQLASLAGAEMKRVTMELGGHAPVLIFNDADIDGAATLLAQLKARNAGQVCMAPSRFYVQKDVSKAFSDKFVDAYSKLIVGDGLLPSTTMGPLAHERRVSFMEELVNDAVKQGATLATGGTRPSGPGYFFPPTVLLDVPSSARVMREEPFGPVVPITSFSNTDEAINHANALPFGLASYVFTRSMEISHRVSSRIESGMVSVNHFGIALAETPLGGTKDSGVGSEGGTETFDAYMNTKFISELSVQ